jgi:cytochrome bd-type quinol oxidase subunit 2
VLPRVLTAVAAAWSLLYLVAYLWVINSQNGAVAWWYVALLVLTALSLGAAAVEAFSAWQRPALTVGFAASALAMLVALLSIGVLLAPTVVTTAIALVVRGRRQARSQAASRDGRKSVPRRRPRQPPGVPRGI